MITYKYYKLNSSEYKLSRVQSGITDLHNKMVKQTAYYDDENYEMNSGYKNTFGKLFSLNPRIKWSKS